MTFIGLSPKNEKTSKWKTANSLSGFSDKTDKPVGDEKH